MAALEHNVVLKNPSRVEVRAAYIYPSTYEAMVSTLAHDLVYSVANSLDFVYLERFHARRLRGEEEPARSLETGTPLKDFGLLLSSLHYEPDIVNLVRVLRASGVEPRRELRRQVLVIGGPVAISNPIPFSGIADAFVIGEIEATLGRVLEIYAERQDDKRSFLEELASLDYIYVPGLKDGARREYVRDLDSAPYPIAQIYNDEVEPAFGRGLKLEVSRGCPFRCSFCMETRLFQPYRRRSLGRLREIVERGLRHVPYRRIVIYALSFPAVADDVRLLGELASAGLEASVPSIRLEKISGELLELLGSLGQRTLSLAPETFSPLLQRAYFKYPGMLDLVREKVEEALGAGFNVKLYLLYGLRGSSLDEAKINVEVLRGLSRVARRHGARLSVSLNPLVPKPRTPFQWIGMESPKRLRSELSFYVEELGGLVESRPLDIRWAVVQAALAMADRDLTDAIVLWAGAGGGLGGWRRALREASLDISYVFRGHDAGRELPWEKVEVDPKERDVARAQYEVVVRLLGFGP
ncbi:MAG: radical SAM protein [Desulfurococcaceae archaeon]